MTDILWHTDGDRYEAEHDGYLVNVAPRSSKDGDIYPWGWWVTTPGGGLSHGKNMTIEEALLAAEEALKERMALAKPRPLPPGFVLFP